MIVVIADDLSGAAELANVAVEAGLTADVQMRFDGSSAADVVCVDTETRLASPERANAIVSSVATMIAKTKPAWCFKKCDSVLRGNVAEEARSIARALRKSRVLLVPANPSRQRIIRNGEYFVDGLPLNESAVGLEMERPRRTSFVRALLSDVHGIESPDTVSYDDVLRHARSVNASTLPVGAADFFRALLELALGRAIAIHQHDEQLALADGPTIFVCGSRTAWQTGRREEFVRGGLHVHSMPAELTARSIDERLLHEWADSVVDSLHERGVIALAIGDAPSAYVVASATLTERLARVVTVICGKVAVHRLYLEGGDTAAAVVSALGFDSFHAEPSPGAGVGALRPIARARPLLLVKPGSYPWPPGVIP